MDTINLLSLNTQGLADYKKRRDVFQYLKQKNPSIVMLQDTHFRKSIENQIRTEWGFECYFASHNSQSRGVAILMNNTFQFSVTKTIKDPNGNFFLELVWAVYFYPFFSA